MDHKVTRNFDSFSWVKFFIRKRSFMIGFGMSNDWASRTPWTFDKVPVPYFHVMNKDREPLVWRILFVGPFLVHFCTRDPNK